MLIGKHGRVLMWMYAEIAGKAGVILARVEADVSKDSDLAALITSAIGRFRRAPSPRRDHRQKGVTLQALSRSANGVPALRERPSAVEVGCLHQDQAVGLGLLGSIFAHGDLLNFNTPSIPMKRTMSLSASYCVRAGSNVRAMAPPVADWPTIFAAPMVRAPLDSRKHS